MNRLLETTERVILDFSQVSRLSSAGIFVFVSLHQAAKRRGIRLVLANVAAEVLEIFQITRVSKLCRIVGDVQEGLDGF
jgi:anti-anti-sigma factor